MATNARQWRLNIGKFVAQAKDQLHIVTYRVVADVASRIIERSPVGDPDLWSRKAPEGYVGGRFRSNWQLGVGAPVKGELYDPKDKSFPDADQTHAKIRAKIPEQSAGEIYFLCNNLPYARRLEEGHSTQAPLGMVGLTVLEWKQIIRNAAKGTVWKAQP